MLLFMLSRISWATIDAIEFVDILYTGLRIKVLYNAQWSIGPYTGVKTAGGRSFLLAVRQLVFYPY